MLYERKGVMLLGTVFPISCTKACLNSFLALPILMSFPLVPGLGAGSFGSSGQTRVQRPHPWPFHVTRIFFVVVSTFWELFAASPAHPHLPLSGCSSPWMFSVDGARREGHGARLLKCKRKSLRGIWPETGLDLCWKRKTRPF